MLLSCWNLLYKIVFQKQESWGHIFVFSITMTARIVELTCIPFF